MKKVFLFIPLLALVGCAPQIAKNGTTTSVSYQQNGTNCVYTEKFDDVFFVSERKGFSKKEKKVSVERKSNTITFADTKCSALILKEVERDTHKSALSNNFQKPTSVEVENKITHNKSGFFY